MIKWIIACACLTAAFSVFAEEDYLFIVLPPKAPVAETSASATAPTAPPTLWERFAKNPYQVWIDSDTGPTMLFTDVEFDAAGNPTPRIPDPYTYDAIVNPTQGTEARRQANVLARLRRFQELQNLTVPVGEAMGHLNSETFQVSRSSDPEALALGDLTAVAPDSRGSKIFTPEQAKEKGIDGSKIPMFPGEASNVEIMWLWDWRCPHCRDAARDWATFADEVTKYGVKAMGISLDNNQDEVIGTLELWRFRGWPVDTWKNRMDVTDLRTAMKIERTPTYLFLDRRSGTLHRYTGVQTSAQLRGALLHVIGHTNDEWPPKTSWIDDTLTDGYSGQPKPSDGESSAIAAPSRPQKLWKPSADDLKGLK
jgi:hypothetical protein